MTQVDMGESLSRARSLATRPPCLSVRGAFVRWAVATTFALAVLASLALLACSPARRSSGPNVLLVTIDTLRADRLKSMGYERDTAPRLEHFFENGTSFENAMSSAPCTIPSVQQLLSSRIETPEQKPFLAEILEREGYRTAAVVSQHQFRYGRLPSFERGFDSFDIQSNQQLDRHQLSTRTAEQVSDRALAWLEENAEAQPFFLWLHYFDPHDPYEPPPEFRRFDARNKADGDAIVTASGSVRWRLPSKAHRLAARPGAARPTAD